MFLLYLISIIFGLMIFLVLICLISIEDQKARIRIQIRLFRQDPPQLMSWKKRIYPYLDAIRFPDWISQIIDEQTVVWSGIQLTHHQFGVIWWLLSLGGIILGAFVVGLGSGNFGMILLGFALVLLPVICPYLYLKYRIRDREMLVERSLPDFLDMLTLTVEAGLGLVPALKRVSSGYQGVLEEEIKHVLAKIELGFSRREALAELVWRIPSPDVEQFVEAIILSERLGTSLARTMRIQANLLRSRRRQRAEVKAQTAPIRIIPALVFFFLPSLLLIYLAPPIINFLLRR